jgi:hypothetical protein
VTFPSPHRAWPLSPRRCPCDLDFVDYLRARSITGKAIFHFGTGAHHVVGRANATAGAPNQVLAVTASPEEHDAYVRLVTEDPGLAVAYKVLFADVYALRAALLPTFDLVTLFHLHEFSAEGRGSYAPLDDAGLLELMCGRTRPGGTVLFYAGSDGARAMRRTVAAAVERGLLVPVERFGSLLVHATPG